MFVDLSETFQTNGMYTSNLYANWYAAEFMVRHGNMMFRVRYPYKTPERAKQMLDALDAHRFNECPMPDYRPIINLMDYYRRR